MGMLPFTFALHPDGPDSAKHLSGAWNKVDGGKRITLCTTSDVGPAPASHICTDRHEWQIAPG